MELFQRSMHDEGGERTSQLVNDIKALPEAELQENLEQLVERMASVYNFLDVPEVLGDEFWMEDVEFDEGKDSTNVRVHIPFKGDGMMFGMSDRSRPMLERRFDIIGHEVVGTYVVRTEHIERLTGEVQKDIEFLNKWLESVRPSIPRYNKSLREWARNEITKRRREIGVRDEATKKLQAVGIPIRKRDDGTEKIVLPVEVERKSVPVPRQSEPKAGKPEQYYVLEMGMYEDILETIGAMVRVMERSRRVFATMEEEDLRTILLVALNGIYKGQATGETFNCDGKADILVRVDDRNVFIAECLMWKGRKYLLSKMNDQLLIRYATWRDTKLALIIFNRGTEFTNVLDEMKKTVNGHPQRLEEMTCPHNNAARYKFRRHDDPQQHFTLTCLAFDVPSKK